jgi:type I restriction enzyme M protein
MDKNNIFVQYKNMLIHSKLIPTSLPELFKEMYYYLYTNSNINKSDKLVQEVLKIVFVKIYSEINSLGKPTSVEDVKSIFELVKVSYNEVFKKEEKISLDDSSILYVINRLERIKFIDADRDSISEAFQSFISSNMRGEKGQFFTPKNVMDMCIDIIEPKPEDKIIDPACGSGGFLIQSLRKIKGLSIENIYGIDKDEDLAKITRAYLAILGNGKSIIFNDDSLNLSFSTKNYIKDNFFDILLTNPPFGTKIKVKDTEILKQYDLGHKFKIVNGKFIKANQVFNQVPQILFIEKSLKLLKDEGRMAIVLPDGVLSNPTHSYVVDYIKENSKIVAVISLPSETFLPSTSTKTSVLFLEKTKTSGDYEIFMAECNFIGHDKNGKPLYKLKPNGEYEIDEGGNKIILDELPDIIRNYKSFKNGKLKNNRLGFSIKLSALENNILIPTYYDINLNEKIQEIKKNTTFRLLTIRELMKDKVISIKRGYEVGSKYYGKGFVPFVRTTDLSNWEIKYNPYKAIPYEVYLKYKNRLDIKENDILLVTDGGFLIGNTALITKYDTEIMIQSHIRRIRCLKPEVLHPCVLLYLLNTKFVQEQIKRKTLVQSTISTIGDRLYDIMLPIPQESDIIEKIYTYIYSIISKKLEIKKKLNEFPDLTEQW